MKKLIYIIFLLCVVIIVSCDKKTRVNVLRIGYTEYSFDQAIVFVLKGILDQQPNLEVELYKVQDSTMFRALADEELDIAVSAWLPNTHQQYFDMYPYEIKKHSMVCDSIGFYMVVPEYAPVRNIEDLQAVAGLMKNTILVPENQNAVYHYSKDLISDYNFSSFEIRESSWDDIMNYVDESIKRVGGFAFVSIRPHWIFKRYKIKTVQDTRQSMGNFEQAYLCINSKLEERLPVVTEFLSKVRFSVNDIETLMEANQTLGTEPYENSLRWINANTQRINKWLTE